jgi:hypothetical protein
MNISDTITILSAMITPVVLIAACGSLILTTSQRLNRSIERTRKIIAWIKNAAETNFQQKPLQEEISIQCEQLEKSTKRAKLLQKAMTALYLSMSIFTATSISIGIVDVYWKTFAWVPVAFGILGACCLFYASILLIRESRIAIAAVNQEMDYAITFVQNRFSPLADELRDKELGKLSVPKK